MNSILILVLLCSAASKQNAVSARDSNGTAPAEYSFRVLEDLTKVRPASPLRANKVGDFVFDNAFQSGYVIGSEIVAFLPGVVSGRGASPWKAYDINDEKTVLASFKWDHSHGLCFITGGTVRSMALSPYPTIMGANGFINNRGEVAFNARVTIDMGSNGKPITAMFAFRLRDEKLTYLRYKESGAAQSTVLGLTESGDAFGTLSFGTARIISNGLGTFQTRPVVWNAKDELIELKLPPKCESVMPAGMIDKDLVVGNALTSVGKSVGVIWRKGEPTLIAVPGVDRTYCNLLPDGRVIAVGWTGSSHDGFVLEGEKWRLLRELIRDFPKDARIRSIDDVCSDGSLLSVISRGLKLYSCFFLKADRADRSRQEGSR